MPGNQFGQLLSLTSFGESHGEAIGGILEGMPAGISIDLAFIQNELDRRKPGQSAIVSQRKEPDSINILSGIFEGKTTGTPIGFIIANEDQRSKDYSHNEDVFRPSHADYTYQAKYGMRDHRGGGRSSARETAVRVAAGAFAKILLSHYNISIHAWVNSVGAISIEKKHTELDLSQIEKNSVRCADPVIAEKMIAYIDSIRIQGDSVGGTVRCVIKNCPAGLGEPVFDRLHADLGKAMLSINAVKGFEYGSGFAGTLLKGSEHNDAFVNENEKIRTATNFSGGIQGGISNGEEIYFTVAFKPVATIMMEQDTVNASGEPAVIKGKGRHDPCVLPRAVPIVEAMSALVLADHLLRHRSSQI